MDFDDPLVKGKPTLNPYLYGVRMIIHRLLWDISFKGYIYRRKLQLLKNTHLDEKAIILCNGPSLNSVDFDLIGPNVYTFGLNKINLLFDRSSFRPNCIVAVNPLVIKQNMPFYNKTEIPLFLDSSGTKKGLITPRQNTIFVYTGDFPHGFAKDCSMNINQGGTVTYVALQLAFHMGFKEVALVGADHTFATKGPANKTVDGDAIDHSHFDSRYFSNMKWQLPDLFESEVAYKRAENVYNAHDRKIYNCTDGGELEIFDRSSLSRFLSQR